MRHTFATMHYAHFRSAAETAAELGHGTSLRMMQRHYLNRVTPAEAQAFWQIVPLAILLSPRNAQRGLLDFPIPCQTRPRENAPALAPKR